MPRHLFPPLGLCCALLAGTVVSQAIGFVPQQAPSPEVQPASVAAAPTLLSLQQAQAHSLQSGDPAAVIGSTKALLAEASRELAQVYLIEGDTAAATTLLEQTADGQPATAASSEVVSTLLRLGNLKEATQQSRLLTERAPESPAAWTLRGMVARTAGDAPDAILSFGRSLQLAPDFNVAYALAAVLLQQHEPEKARRLFADIFRGTDNAAIWHVAAGDAYREARYYEQAAQQFQEALALDPRAVHAEFFLGLTYLQMNEWGPNSGSFEHLRKAIAQSPSEYISNFYLGALESTDGSDLASSDLHLQTAASADATQPEVWLYLGLNANREHNLPAAETYFRKSIELTGPDVSRNNWQVRRAFFGLGRILIAEGKQNEGKAMLARYREAEQASVAASGAKITAMGGGNSAPETTTTMAAPRPQMTAAIPSANPALAVPSTPAYTEAQRQMLTVDAAHLKQILGAGWNDLGVAQARQKEYTAAVASLRNAESWGNTTPELLHNLGAAAFRAQDFAEVSRVLPRYVQATSAVNSAPSPHETQQLQRAEVMLGYAEAEQDHYKQAIAAFQSAPEATMADPRAAYEWAHALARTGDAGAANRIADTLIKAPLPDEALGPVCHLYLEDEDYEGTLRCYRKAYGQNPGMKLAHYEAGEALVHLDRPQEALTELREEQQLSPGDPNISYAVAYAMLQTSDKAAAQDLLTTITRDHPEQAQAQYQLGKLLLEQGKVSEAIVHLEISEADDSASDYTHYQLGTAYRRANRASDAAHEFGLYQAIKDKKRNGNAASATGQAAPMH